MTSPPAGYTATEIGEWEVSDTGDLDYTTTPLEYAVDLAPGGTTDYYEYIGVRVGFAGVDIAGDVAYVSRVSLDVVPEPATMGLLAIGGLGILIRRKRK